MTLYDIIGAWALLPALLAFIFLVFFALARPPDLFSGDDDEFF